MLALNVSINDVNTATMHAVHRQLLKLYSNSTIVTLEEYNYLVTQSTQIAHVEGYKSLFRLYTALSSCITC